MAFAKYYWNEQSRALHVGDTSTLERLYSPECDVCQTYVDMITKDFKKGLRANIVATKIKGVEVTDQTENKSDQAVTVTASDASYELVDATGEAIGRTEPIDYRVILYVDWKDSQWTVVDSYMFT